MRGDVLESGGEHRFQSGAANASIADKPRQVCRRRPHTKNNDTCVSHTSQNGTPRHQHGGRCNAYGAALPAAVCEAFEKMIDVIADSRRISRANFDEKAFHGEAQMKCGKIG